VSDTPAPTSDLATKAEEDRVIIYAGTLRVDPDRRDRFVAARHEQIVAARAKPGVLEYAICADPVDPALVQIFECYQDEEALGAHEKVHSRNQEVPVLAMDVYRYESETRTPLVLPEPTS
jgi:quinol monooxygenase YgiN